MQNPGSTQPPGFSKAIMKVQKYRERRKELVFQAVLAYNRTDAEWIHASSVTCADRFREREADRRQLREVFV